MSERITLAVLAPLPVWVAWQSEPRGKKETKVPYSARPGANGKAMADNPKTWGTRADAETRAARLPKPLGTGGIGIEFALLADGRRTGGIDLDTCRDPVTGVIEPWAQSVIDRFRCYAEISPSQTGVKLFFLYAAVDEMTLREALGRTPTGELKYSTPWKLKTGDDHPPAIELHLGNRYFTTTDQIMPGSTDELCEVATDDLLHLIRVTGPEFARAAPCADPRTKLTALLPSGGKKQKSAATDQSRSAIAFRVAAAGRRRGIATYDAMCAELRDHELTADWYVEKGTANGGRELQRLWDKTDPAKSAFQNPLYDAELLIRTGECRQF